MSDDFCRKRDPSANEIPLFRNHFKRPWSVQRGFKAGNLPLLSLSLNIHQRKASSSSAPPSRVPRYNFPNLNALSTAANPTETAPGKD